MKGNIMEQNAIDRASSQFKSIPLFECCYVNAGNRSASYVVSVVSMTNDDGETDYFNDVMFYRTINIVTGELIEEQFALGSDYAELNECLSKHYSAEYIQHDAIILSVEQLCFDDDRLHMHEKFGRAVYFADLDEIQFDDDDGENCILPW
jgi:hypothetical protein